MTPDEGVSLRVLSVGFLVGFIALLLGGEGRFFYANIDWQVRNAVLRDMGMNPWPFVYTARAVPDVLRAPIGMFLIPALAFKALGARAGDIALLIQNSALLGLLLAMASRLFATPRARLCGLIVFLAFSGLDAAGEVLTRGALADHLENWAGIQYSSTVTLAFWVPQHALSGWTGAVLFLLWRTQRIPLAAFLALLPLTALWSPLGLLGTLPFAALAGIETAWRHRLKAADIALPALACLLCLPGLLYLAAAGEDVGVRPFPIEPLRYLVFQMFETAPYLIPLGYAARRNRFGLPVFALVTVCLLLMPFVQIGWSIDFMMRASIPALTILAVMVADALLPGDSAATPQRRIWLFGALALGSVTGLSEIRRAFVQPPAPEVSCTFFKAWDQSFADFPKGSYLAPLPQMPPLIRPTDPAHASAVEPAHCWPGVWYRQ